MEDKEIPIGATCHHERDKDGRWWIVWGADFVGDKSGRREHPESVFLEDAYRAGKEYGAKEGYECGVYNGKADGIAKGMRDVVAWLENNFEPTVPMSLDYKKWHRQLGKWGLNESLPE